MTDDPHDLARFLDAQQESYDAALAEIRRGRKASHWMWFVFPQFAGLGRSPASQRFAIRSLAEARAYLGHPILGARLTECATAVLANDGLSAFDVFGTPDDLKLRSCMTLFAHVAAPGSVFQQVLERRFGGEPDARTLALIGG